MAGISKIMMSSFFLLGLFLIIPRAAAQTTTTTTNATCTAVAAKLSACADLFNVGAGVGVGVGVDVGVGVGVGVDVGVGNGATPPRGCCTGLQQIEAIEAEIGAETTCRCIRRSKIFSNPLNISLNAAILGRLLADCAGVVGANISIDLSCLTI